MRVLKLFFALVFVFGTIASFSSLNFSKPADAKKTGKPCLYCHKEYGKADLTKAGECYKKKGTLEGCGG